MQIIIIGGFLGSGKTSVLIPLARYLTKDSVPGAADLVIIENEIGEIGVDDKVLTNQGYEVQNLFSGCVCCTLIGALTDNLRTIQKELNPRYVILETTGMAVPSSIKKSIAQYLEYPTSICCVVDAKRWLRMTQAISPAFLGNQLSESDVILINKMDMVQPDELEAVKQAIGDINAGADIYCISAGTSIDDEVLASIIGKLVK